MIPDLLVIGGGAAGCFAAVHAARRGLRVHILDANDRLMHKLSITGKGRCNLTNACDRETLLANIPRNPRFLYSAFSRCMPQDVMCFFETEGVPLKTERGRRVFPQSDKAADIVEALTRAMQGAGVTWETGCRVKKLLIQDGRCCGAVTENGTEYPAKNVLIAAGGMSYPRTGSRGDGYALAKAAGHTVTPPQPSLIPLETDAADQAAEMQGLALKNVTLTLTRGKKGLFSEMGEMLFTHFGVSGPLVLSASCYIEPAKVTEYLLTVDTKPALTPEQLDARLRRDFDAAKNKTAGNALKGLLPASMLPVVLQRAGLPAEKKVHDITKQERQALVTVCKRFTLHPAALRPVTEAIITRGGVSVKEVNPNTMASKLTAGLYFAGEVLDVDAFTGGYNLQIAFATALTAALSVN